MSAFPWRLGKLGAVFVVLIATGVIVYFLVTGNPQPDPHEAAIRAYYESKLGARVPPTVANRLQVEVCDVPGAENVAVVHCTVTVDGHKWYPCFGFNLEDRVVNGPYQDTRSDCDRVVYDAGRRTFVLAP